MWWVIGGLSGIFIGGFIESFRRAERENWDEETRRAVGIAPKGKRWYYYFTRKPERDALKDKSS